MKRKILIILLILTLAFIWGHSMLPEQASQEESYTMSQIINPDLEWYSEEMTNTDNLLRKAAHLLEYAILGVELTLLLFGKKQWYRLVLLAGFLTAFLDESIQVLSLRGAQIQDVWLDFGGVLAVATIGLAYQKVKQKRADI